MSQNEEPPEGRGVIRWLDRDDRVFGLIVIGVFGAPYAGYEPLEAILTGLTLAAAWPFTRWVHFVLQTHAMRQRHTQVWGEEAQRTLVEHATAPEMERIEKSVEELKRGIVR